jgi:hypothetical protein
VLTDLRAAVVLLCLICIYCYVSSISAELHKTVGRLQSAGVETLFHAACVNLTE